MERATESIAEGMTSALMERRRVALCGWKYAVTFGRYDRPTCLPQRRHTVRSTTARRVSLRKSIMRFFSRGWRTWGDSPRQTGVRGLF
jgi:ribosomal protein L15E